LKVTNQWSESVGWRIETYAPRRFLATILIALKAEIATTGRSFVEKEVGVERSDAAIV